MPVYRTPDGKIVEEKTVKEDATEHQELPPAPPAGGGDAAGGDARRTYQTQTRVRLIRAIE